MSVACNPTLLKFNMTVTFTKIVSHLNLSMIFIKVQMSSA